MKTLKNSGPNDNPCVTPDDILDGVINNDNIETAITQIQFHTCKGCTGVSHKRPVLASK